MCKSSKKIRSVFEPLKTQPLKPDLDNLISRVGSLKKLIRITALVMRVKLCDFKITKDSSMEKSSGENTFSKIGEISAREYRDAWLYISY